MQTVRSQEKIEITPAPITLANSKSPDSTDPSKKIRIREMISWAVCFGIVAGLTGLMKVLNVAVTMDAITSTLFYLSLAGLVYIIYRIISISRNPVQLNKHSWHELN